MRDKAFKQYLEEKYHVKIKKVKMKGLYGCVLPSYFYVILVSKSYDLLDWGWEPMDHKLHKNLSQVADAIAEEFRIKVEDLEKIKKAFAM